VRDSLLGVAPADWDICTSALPGEVCACFTGCKVIPTGLAHGTVTVLMNGRPAEITTFRSDGDYLDHRRPSSVDFSVSLREDMARRDFTVNAMAYSPAEGLVDLFGGAGDLAQRRLRCVGDPAARFCEDALRILRLFRFSAQLNFSIEPATLAGAADCRGYLDHIAGERVCKELSGLLVSPRPGSALAAMCACGVLQQIVPEFAPCVGFDQNTPYHNRTVDAHTFAAVDAAPPQLPVRLALLLHDIGKPICCQERGGVSHFPGHDAEGARIARGVLRRLRFDSATASRAVKLIALHDQDIPPDPAALRRLLSRLGEQALRQMLEVNTADNRAKNPAPAAERLSALLRAREMLEALCAEGPPVRLGDLAVDGEDLLRLGYPQDARLGEALQILLEEVLQDPARNERAWLLERAGSMLTATGAPPPTGAGR